MKPLAPHLSSRDIEDELRTIHQRPHHTLNTALYARGAEGEVAALCGAETQRFRVVPVHSELELRAALLSAPPPVVALIDYTTELPPDVQVRLAGRGLRFPSEERRLSRKFGGAPLSMELLACQPLCRALLDDGEENLGEVPGLSVSLEHGFRILLERRVRYRRSVLLTVERILEFAAERSDALEQDRRLCLPAEDRLAAEWLSFLERTAGKVAVLVWRAWERGQGRQGAALALVLETTAQSLTGYLRGTLVQLLERLEPGLGQLVVREPQTLQRWGEAAAHLGRSWEPGSPIWDATLREAEAMLPDPAASEALRDSRWLRQSYFYWKDDLARHLGRLAARPTVEDFVAARIALERLQRHTLGEQPQNSGRIERAQMALRLGGYLLDRKKTLEATTAHGREVVARLASHYLTDGAFVDYARAVGRGGPGRSSDGGERDDKLDEAIRLVVATVDALRDQLDERFAHALPEWLRDRRPIRQQTGQGVLPIEEALERLGADFLKGHKERKLLVLVMDGMAWPNAVELLLSLEEELGGRHAPLCWLPEGRERLPVLAALPTTTEVSRAALFAGKLPRSGQLLSTIQDVARFAEHAALNKQSDQTPRLLLRPDLETSTGDARREAIDLILSPARVVGVVVNAIDDQLHGSRQVHLRYRASTIKPLGPLLDAAAESGRAILLCADHGHVPGSRLEYVGYRTTGGGSRWRTLAEDETPKRHELLLDGEGVWRPRGKSKVAVLYREVDTYGVGASAGEHGGVSLTEMVVPALLLGSVSLRKQVAADDPELGVAPLPRPGWWDLELTTVPTSMRAAARGSVAEKRKEPEASQPPKIQQLGFGLPEPPARPTAATPESTSEWRQLLLGSSLLKAMAADDRQKLIARVEVLASHKGQLPADVFARRIGVLPSRIAGVVADLDEALNVDGNRIVHYDRTGNQVRLDLELLRTLYAED